MHLDWTEINLSATQPTPPQKVQKKELYHSWKQAYNTSQYSKALFFFEDFGKFNSAYLTKHNGLKNSLKGAIAICKRHVREEKLREEELSKRNTSSHFSAAAMHKAPVLYYKPQALMVSDEEKKRLNKGNRSALFGYVDFLEKWTLDQKKGLCSQAI